MYRLTRFSLTHPAAMLVILALITIGLGFGLTRLRTEFGYRVLIGDDHPSIQRLDRFIAQFGGGLPVQIAWECGPGHPCSDVFDEASLRMADNVERKLASVRGIQRVQGPANASLLVPSAGGFNVRHFVGNGLPVSDVARLADRAVIDPFWAGTLVSRDRTVAVIIVQSSDTDSETDVHVVEAIESSLAPHRERGFEFYLIGQATDNVVGGRALAESSASLIPITVLVIALVLVAHRRSVALPAIALAGMGVALLWTFGLLGWLDWPQDGILEVLAPLILVVGVCDAVHLLERFAVCCATFPGGGTEENRRDAMLTAVREVGAACIATTATTGVAFASFATSQLGTFVRLGAISAFGVLACLILTFTLVPIFACLTHRPKNALDGTRSAWRPILAAVARTTERRYRLLLGVSAGLLALCAFGWATRLRVENDWIESYGEDSEIVRGIRFVEERMGPVDTLEVEVSIPRELEIEDPEMLAALDRFTQMVALEDGVSGTRSVLDLVRWVNRMLHEDDPGYEMIGDTRSANSEILELVGFDDPASLSGWVSFDRRSARVSFQTPQLPSARASELMEKVAALADVSLPADSEISFSGEVAVTADWVRDVQQTQLRSFPTAFVLIFVMVSIFLRSLRLGFVAMVPTILPVVVVLGTMGWLGMGLDVGRAMIATVIIGIGVDDSIHVLSQFKRRRDAGAGPREAMRGAILHTGSAVVTTSLALSLGFLTLMASAWQTISSFGFFVALAILGALAAVLFVLPALIYAFAPDDEEAAG